MFFWEIIHENMLYILLLMWTVMIVHDWFKIKIPTQLVFLILWIAITSLGFETPNELKVLSALAIIFMLFSAELWWHNVPHFITSIIKNIKVAVIAAIGPWVWAFVFSNLWWWNMQEAIVLWAVFTATALPFTIWVLKEFKMMKTQAAHTAITAATADDIIATLVGIITSILLWSSLSWKSDYSHVFFEIWMVLWFFIFIYILHVLIVKLKLLKNVNWNVLTILIFWWWIIAIWEGVFHIHYAIAALLAWVLITPEFFKGSTLLSPDFLKNKNDIFANASEKLTASSNYIAPFFFVYLGSNLDLSFLIETPIILVSGFGLFLTVVIFQFISAYSSWRWRGLNNKQATILGFAMSPRDVVAIVILDMNLAYITNEFILPSVILAIFLLNITATLWMKWANNLSEKKLKISS